MTPLNIVFVHSLAVFARLRRENAQCNEFYGGGKQDDEDDEYRHAQQKNLAAGCWSDVPPEKFYFEIFSKTNAVSITFGLRYIHGQSLKEIDFPTRNEVDRF